ncbi:MAG: Asp-tRNA(Asn)/Glu-tRNA(Gln) amidotransferase subunit GatC [Neisseriaceae bacterium]|nr:Asp-tRNA(Asn)/Glu-tRNA(Gln) amidotransferase subunit GatC [Neisseriaceae bacterium]MBR5676409.1 Asp-tRNA(Asn)/Glu-tRNA(Gln) amidotransferase subunit GatC [Neisseriaceae bacterium]MBR5941335.1 Asp-tRNA(Asn)/Glu-tRNA(Gln) amidotransferase subunit GatC [Neisseriaceae bacterium]
MSLAISDVEKIAKLSRLALNDEQKQRTLTELNGIFDMIAKMQAVNTDGVEPLSHPIEFAQRLREDKVTEPERREAYQAVAPQVEQNLYIVPKVIE